MRRAAHPYKTPTTFTPDGKKIVALPPPYVPPPSVTVRINPEGLTPAFAAWRELRRRAGRSEEGIPRKVMRFWISAGIKKIPKGDMAKIERDLMRAVKYSAKSRRTAKTARVRKKRKRDAALAAKYRGTVAELLVRKLNWQNANAAVRKDGSPAFYGKVGQFIGARKWSRNLHRAGFYPVINKLRVDRDGYLPRGLKRLPGTYEEKFSDNAALLIADNMASTAQRPGGDPPATIAGLAPNCLKDSEREMARLFEKWLAEDEAAYARRAGFFATAT